MKIRKIHPYIQIIMTFNVVVITGALLLMLPISAISRESIGFVDALFTSTSCVCVTGLTVIDVSSTLSVFGKFVMVVLMEIGGLSFITIAIFFFLIIGGRLGVSNKFMVREALNQSTVNNLSSLIVKIIIISATVQLVGAMINLIPLMKIYNNDFWTALGVSLYHSCAAFNNAGFDIFGPTSMINYSDNIILNTTTMIMIVIGGIGFVVIDDIFKGKRWKRFNLHTKITLSTTFILIFGGMLLIKFTCWNDMTWLQALFTSITSRTAGFTTYDMSDLKNHPATYVIIVILMVIGASSCSTGGGIKTSTFAVIILTVFYFAKGEKTKIFERRISGEQKFKAFCLLSVAVLIIIVGVFLVAVFQPSLTKQGFGIEEILFEVASAFSTTGLSMGLTPFLNPANRILLCVIMLLGRLGPLTVIGVINKNWMATSKEPIRYVKENVIIG